MISSFGPEFDSLHLHGFLGLPKSIGFGRLFLLEILINAKLDKQTFFNPTANNFDFLRFLASFGVFSCHFLILNHINRGMSPETMVCVFFVISGILIYRSYERCDSLKVYWEKRIRRIVPIYMLVVLLSAVAAVSLSTLPWKEYFLSLDLYKYLFWNAIFMNFMHPDLPGVLDGAAINPSLWTIKVELFCYFLIPLIFGLVKKTTKKAMIWVSVSVCVLSACCRSSAEWFEMPAFDMVGKYSLVVACFMVGVCIYLYFEKIVNLKYRCFLTVVALIVLSVDGFVSNLLTPVSVGMIVFVLAFGFKFLNGFGRVGDPSYGLYLCHGPVIMFFIGLQMPASFSVYVLESVIVLSFSFFSWHLFEKRLLKRKNKKKQIVN